MGTLRYTGKAFQLVGDLLTADAFEAWLEATGKALLEERIKRIGGRWLFGHVRAKNALRREIINDLEKSDVLRAALVRELDLLPQLLYNAADFMLKERAPHFNAGTYGKRVVAVPRAIVANEIRATLAAALSGSRELGRFTGFPGFFLDRKADAAEKALFEHLAKDVPIGIHDDRAIVLGVDRDFDWAVGRPLGHYYIGLANWSLKEKKERKELISDLEPFVETLKAQLGSLTTEEMRAFAGSFSVA
jgi:hypothetical protein